MGNSASSSGEGSRSRSRSAPARTALPPRSHRTQSSSLPEHAAEETIASAAPASSADNVRAPSPPATAPALNDAEKAKKKLPLMSRLKRGSLSRERSAGQPKINRSGKEKGKKKRHDSPQRDTSTPGDAHKPVPAPPEAVNALASSTTAPPHASHVGEHANASDVDRSDDDATRHVHAPQRQSGLRRGAEDGHTRVPTALSISVLSHTPVFSDEDEGNGGAGQPNRHAPPHSRLLSRRTGAVSTNGGGGTAVDSALNASGYEGTLDGSFQNPVLAGHPENAVAAANLLPVATAPSAGVSAKALNSPWWRRSPIRRRSRSLETDDSLVPPHLVRTAAALSDSPCTPPPTTAEAIGEVVPSVATAALSGTEVPEGRATANTAVPTPSRSSPSTDLEADVDVPVDAMESAGELAPRAGDPADAFSAESEMNGEESVASHTTADTIPDEGVARTQLTEAAHVESHTAAGPPRAVPGKSVSPELPPTFSEPMRARGDLRLFTPPCLASPPSRGGLPPRSLSASDASSTGSRAASSQASSHLLRSPCAASAAPHGPPQPPQPVLRLMPVFTAMPHHHQPPPQLSSPPNGESSLRGARPRSARAAPGGTSTPRSGFSTPGMPPMPLRRSIDSGRRRAATASAAGATSLLLADDDEEDPPTTHYDAERHYLKPPAQSDAEVEALYAAVPEETSIDEDWDDEEEDEGGEEEDEEDSDMFNRVEEIVDDEADGDLAQSLSKAGSSRQSRKQRGAGGRRPRSVASSSGHRRIVRSRGQFADSAGSNSSVGLRGDTGSGRLGEAGATRTDRFTSSVVRRSIHRQLMRGADRQLTPRGAVPSPTASSPAGSLSRGRLHPPSPRRRSRAASPHGETENTPAQHDTSLNADTPSTATTVCHHDEVLGDDVASDGDAVPFDLPNTPSPRSPLSTRSQPAPLPAPRHSHEMSGGAPSSVPERGSSQQRAYLAHGRRRHSPRQSSTPSWMLEDEPAEPQPLATEKMSLARRGTALPKQGADHSPTARSARLDKETFTDRERELGVESSQPPHARRVRGAARSGIVRGSTSSYSWVARDEPRAASAPSLEGRPPTPPAGLTRFPSLPESRDAVDGRRTQRDAGGVDERAAGTGGHGAVDSLRHVSSSLWGHSSRSSTRDTSFIDLYEKTALPIEASQSPSSRSCNRHDAASDQRDALSPLDAQQVMSHCTNSDSSTSSDSGTGEDDDATRMTEQTERASACIARPPAPTASTPLMPPTTTTAPAQPAKAPRRALPSTPHTAVGAVGAGNERGVEHDTSSVPSLNWVEVPAQASLTSLSVAPHDDNSAHAALGSTHTTNTTMTTTHSSESGVVAADALWPSLSSATRPPKKTQPISHATDAAARRDEEPETPEAPDGVPSPESARQPSPPRNLPTRRAHPRVPRAPSRPLASAVVPPPAAPDQDLVSTPPTPRLDPRAEHPTEGKTVHGVAKPLATTSQSPPSQNVGGVVRAEGPGRATDSTSGRSRLEETTGSGETDEEQPWWNRSRRGQQSSPNLSVRSPHSNVFAETDRSGWLALAVASAMAAVIVEHDPLSPVPDHSPVVSQGDSFNGADDGESTPGAAVDERTRHRRRTEEYTTPPPPGTLTQDATASSPADPTAAHVESESPWLSDLSARDGAARLVAVRPTTSDQLALSVGESNAEDLTETVVYSASRPPMVRPPSIAPPISSLLSQEALRRTVEADGRRCAGGGVVLALRPLTSFSTAESNSESDVRDDTVGSTTHVAVLHPLGVRTSQSDASAPSAHPPHNPHVHGNTRLREPLSSGTSGVIFVEAPDSAIASISPTPGKAPDPSGQHTSGGASTGSAVPAPQALSQVLNLEHSIADLTPPTEALARRAVCASGDTPLLPMPPRLAPPSDAMTLLTASETWHRQLLQDGALAVLDSARAWLSEVLSSATTKAAEVPLSAPSRREAGLQVSSPDPAALPADLTNLPEKASHDTALVDEAIASKDPSMSLPVPAGGPHAHTPRAVVRADSVTGDGAKGDSGSSTNDACERAGSVALEEEETPEEDGHDEAASAPRSPDVCRGVAALTVADIFSLTGASASTVTFSELSPSSRRPSLMPGLSPHGAGTAANSAVITSTELLHTVNQSQQVDPHTATVSPSPQRPSSTLSDPHCVVTTGSTSDASVVGGDAQRTGGDGGAALDDTHRHGGRTRNDSTASSAELTAPDATTTDNQPGSEQPERLGDSSTDVVRDHTHSQSPSEMTPSSASAALLNNRSESGAFSVPSATGTLLHDLLPVQSIVTVSSMTESRPRKARASAPPSTSMHHQPPSTTMRAVLSGDETDPLSSPPLPPSMAPQVALEGTSPTPEQRATVRDGSGGGASHAVCQLCHRRYDATETCPVAQQPHRELLARRKHEKAVKKAAQALLADGKVSDAVRLLAAEGVVPATVLDRSPERRSHASSPSPRPTRPARSESPPHPPPATDVADARGLVVSPYRQLLGNGPATPRAPASSYWNTPACAATGPRAVGGRVVEDPNSAPHPLPKRRGRSYGMLSPARDD